MALLKFPIYRSHLDLAKTIWEKHLFVGAKIIDATCGNGKDSLYLAKSILSASEGEIFCLDIQECAISNTSNLLKTHLEPETF